MGNRDTILNAQFPPAVLPTRYLEVDLRTLNGFGVVGRRGQLQIGSKLVFTSDEFRKGQSAFWLWADVRVEGQEGVPLGWPFSLARET